MTRRTSKTLALALAALLTGCVGPPTGGSGQNNALPGDDMASVDMLSTTDMASPSDMAAPEDLGAVDMSPPTADMPGDMSGSGDMPPQPCGGLCAGETPVCNTNNNRCVGCLKDDDCSEDTPSCDTTTNTCVECKNSSQCDNNDLPYCHMSDFVCVECGDNSACPTPDASQCDLSGSCVECSDSTHCAHLQNLQQCVDGTCMECTPETENMDCGNNACLPDNTCGTTPRESLETCSPCEADHECKPDHRCVPMTFGSPATHHGNYCLELGSGNCERPYIQIAGPASVSGEPPTQYCGVNQELTTCEAVLDMLAPKTCTSDDDCGATNLDDGDCPLGTTRRCSIRCSSQTQCPEGRACSPTNSICI